MFLQGYTDAIDGGRCTIDPNRYLRGFCSSYTSVASLPGADGQVSASNNEPSGNTSELNGEAENGLENVRNPFISAL